MIIIILFFLNATEAKCCLFQTRFFLFFSQFAPAASTSTSIAAPLAWRVLRLLRSVVPPTLRAVMLLCLVPCNSVLLSMIGTATTFMSVFELKVQ